MKMHWKINFECSHFQFPFNMACNKANNETTMVKMRRVGYVFLDGTTGISWYSTKEAERKKSYNIFYVAGVSVSRYPIWVFK